ncbi:MAG: hypothetical protein HQ517_11465, partial [SAR324 cluster bacterium]|nr:hypothetical protein [SAR324 cluster bacterium]
QALLKEKDEKIAALAEEIEALKLRNRTIVSLTRQVKKLEAKLAEYDELEQANIQNHKQKGRKKQPASIKDKPAAAKN